MRRKGLPFPELTAWIFIWKAIQLYISFISFELPWLLVVADLNVRGRTNALGENRGSLHDWRRVDGFSNRT